MAAPPHEPDHMSIAPTEWPAYRLGYETALLFALRTMDHAEQRYQLYLNTRRLETRRKRAGQREKGR
jgi:hypothetical protein